MIARPLTLREANRVVAEMHRHHKPSRGHRFSFGAYEGPALVGICIVGRPVSREYDPSKVAEVSRVATDGTKNACSFLYGAAARACDAMGYESIQTYTLPEEGGASLRAAGWINEGPAGGGSWNNGAKTGRRDDQPQDVKTRWRKTLTNGRTEASA